jgi:hypothetical protein
MPLTFGIPIGLVIAVFGAILFSATRYKKVAIVVVGIGGIIAVLTFILVALAAISPM